MHNKLNMTEIPFKFMNHSTRFKLANKLDPKATLTGNDWRMLAEKLGYKNEEITVIEAQRSEDGRNTLKLFAHYEKQEDCSVNRVLEALQEMERKDALEVLQEALPGIEKSYKAEMEVQQKHRSQPMEHELQHWPQTNSYHSNSTNYRCNYSCHVHPAVYNSYEYYPLPSAYKSQTNDHIRRPHSQKTQYPSFTYNGNSCPVHTNHTGEMEVHSRQNNLPQDMRSFVTEEDNSSMVVQPDLNSRDEFSIVENDIVMKDDQVPLPKAIFRAQNPMMNIPSHESDDFDIAREEEVSTSTSEDFSSGDSDLVPLGERKDYYRQRSDECNSNQPLKDAGLRNTKSSCIPKSLSDHDVPLENLKRLANLPKQYMPNQDYTTIVAEQKIDNSQQKVKLIGDERSIFAVANCTRRADNQPENFDSKKVSPKLKNGVINAPNTFPMRMKPHSNGVIVADIRQQHEKMMTITKSVSLPNDMKPEVFRKAFRHIKVFVTFSEDGKKHVQRVLSLCKCLIKNGFSCFVDVQGRKMENCVQSLGDVDWYKQKFMDADFVLVCVSNKYKADIENSDSNDFSQNKLHTKYIYKLMLEEFEAKNNRNARFVPVLMEGVNQKLVPSWLQHTTLYHWPVQYKDLLWMLSKPEERINPKPKNYSQ